MARDGITKMVSPITSKTTYRARWSFIDPTGTRRFGSKVLPTRRQAERYLRERQVEVQAGRYRAPSKLTVNEYAEEWMTRKSRAWAPGTTRLRRRHWRTHLAPRIGAVKLVDLSRYHCQQLVSDLEATCAPATLRVIVGELRALLNGAVGDELILRNPATRLTLPALPPREMTTWSADQVQRFLHVTRAHPDHPAYVVLFTTGVRVGELLALRWTHVDLDRGTMRVADTVREQTDGTLAPSPGTKTTKDRVIPLTPGCVEALKAHQEAQHAIRADAKVWDLRGYVFAREDGSPMPTTSFGGRFRTAVKRSGLPPITVHGARHTVATLLVMAGVPDRVVQDLLGHASITQTLGTYSHVTDRSRGVARDEIAAVLEANGESETRSNKL